MGASGLSLPIVSTHHVRTLLVAAALGFRMSPLLMAEAIEVYQTSEGTKQRIEHVASMNWLQMPQPSESQQCVVVDPLHGFQTFIGIGGALTDAAAETYAALPTASRKEVMRAYYDPIEGIGYTLGRTTIHSCDFSSDSYTYVKEGDVDLGTFDVAHDRRNRIPLIKDAFLAAGGSFPVFASPWSPPAWMKDNGSMLKGGHLKPEYGSTWARYIAKFIQAYSREGIPIWAVTVQNEPMASQTWESCVFTAQEEAAFIRDHLGPTLAREGLGQVKIIGWDHNRTQLLHRATVLMSDPAVARYVWGLGYHWYLDDAFANVREVHDTYPKLHLLLTEACNGPFERGKMDEWALAEQYGRSMIADFNSGAEAWTDWNIILDQNGGPNHLGNYCFAPIHCDTLSGGVHKTPTYYYIGHFSKFIRPGATRIVCSSTMDRLQTTAFRNASGSVALVVMNSTEKTTPYFVWSEGKAAAVSIPGHSIQTIVIGP